MYYFIIYFLFSIIFCGILATFSLLFRLITLMYLYFVPRFDGLVSNRGMEAKTIKYIVWFLFIFFLLSAYFSYFILLALYTYARFCDKRILHFGKYRKISKIILGAYIFEELIFGRAYIRRAKFTFQNRLRLYWEGNVRLKIHRANL